MNASKGNIELWVRNLRDIHKSISTKVAPLTAEQKEIRELKKNTIHKELENEILKKATALLM